MIKREFICLFFIASLSTVEGLSEPAQGNLRIEPPNLLSHYDKKISDFAIYFSKTSAGKLLKEVVEDIARYPRSGSFVRQPVYSPYPGVGQYQVARRFGPLEGYTTGSPQQGSALITAFISLLTLLCAVPFALFAVFGGARNLVVYAWSAIAGYIVATLSFAIFYGVLPNWILCLTVLSLGVVTIMFAYQRPGKELAFLMTFFACLLAGNLIYDLLAGLPIEAISPAFCGIAGLIFNTGIANTYFYVMRLMYFGFILIFGFLIYSFIPKYVTSSEPQTAQEREFAATCTRYIICFICAWIVSGGLLQLFYLLGSAFNPLDPSSTFFVPTQIRWNTWESYVALAFWGALTYIFAYFRERYEQDSRFDPQLVSQEVKEQWKRATSQ